MSPTRRALLGSVALGAVCGCLGGGRDDGSGPLGRSSTVSGTDRDPTLLKVRNDWERPAVVETGTDGDGVGGAAGGGGMSDAGSLDRVRTKLVTTAEQAARLRAAPEVADADRERIQAFLDETDYDAETVYVSAAGVMSCRRLVVSSVSWRSGRVEYEYCRERRPPDEPCEADTRVSLALLFRLPVALDGRLIGTGSGGRSPCRATDTDYAVIDGNASVPGDPTALDEGGDGS